MTEIDAHAKTKDRKHLARFFGQFMIVVGFALLLISIYVSEFHTLRSITVLGNPLLIVAMGLSLVIDIDSKPRKAIFLIALLAALFLAIAHQV